MENVRTNWLAVAACALIGMGIGFLWYGVLFQKQWMAGNGITAVDDTTMTMTKNGVEQATSSFPMLFNFVVMAVYAFVMNWLLQRANARTWMEGIKVGAAIGFISLLAVFTNNLFAGTSTELSKIDGSYIFVLFTVFGALIGGWQKK